MRRQCVHSARQGGEEHLRTTTACCSASSICTATTFPRQIICMRREPRHSQKQNGFWVGRFEFVVVFEGITHLSSNQSPSPAAACMCTLVKCFSSILRQERPSPSAWWLKSKFPVQLPAPSPHAQPLIVTQFRRATGRWIAGLAAVETSETQLTSAGEVNLLEVFSQPPSRSNGRTPPSSRTLAQNKKKNLLKLSGYSTKTQFHKLWGYPPKPVAHQIRNRIGRGAWGGVAVGVRGRQ